jgi:predicted DNA-binding transcriptional regulator AlpA
VDFFHTFFRPQLHTFFNTTVAGWPVLIKSMFSNFEPRANSANGQATADAGGQELRAGPAPIAAGQELAGDQVPVRLVDRRGLARMLSVSPRKIDRMKKAGELPAPIRLPGRAGKKRWLVAEIDRWIAADMPGLEKWELLKLLDRTRAEHRRRRGRRRPITQNGEEASGPRLNG